MGSWHEMIQQRHLNRGERGSWQRQNFLEGHRRRKGIAIVTDKKTDEVTVVAQNGCFGRLATVDRDKYDAWAAGTRGAL